MKNICLVVVSVNALSSSVGTQRYIPTPLPWTPPDGWNKEGLCKEECTVLDEEDEFDHIFDQVYAETLILPNDIDVAENDVYLPLPADELALFDRLDRVGQVASHELVQLNSKTGSPEQKDFVIVDEVACHGCSHCTLIAAMTFGTESRFGKARVYLQDGDSSEAVNEAIQACPRNAIKRVGFDELVRFERLRDEIDNTIIPSTYATYDDDELFRKRILGHPYADL